MDDGLRSSALYKLIYNVEKRGAKTCAKNNYQGNNCEDSAGMSVYEHCNAFHNSEMILESE
ncbi:unnamed protein product [Sphenostylis stenocarpa]|uniref:Uncharacterized protein n=1 Tax=Sphenostylis stenocarpa TaxID=92480 RepID=A0AA86SFW7_9FABA|nr:unnamed protein product [Sphenostylis stenocarpa]